jgi:hypothetical protein
MLKLVLNIKLFLLLCFYVAVKCILALLQDKNTAEQYVLLFNPAKIKKDNKHFKIQRQFQNLTNRPNDMIHGLVLDKSKTIFSMY